VTRAGHELAAGGQLQLTDRAGGRGLELGQQLRGLLPARVALPVQERLQARLPQPARVRRAGIPLQERK